MKLEQFACCTLVSHIYVTFKNRPKKELFFHSQKKKPDRSVNLKTKQKRKLPLYSCRNEKAKKRNRTEPQHQRFPLPKRRRLSSRKKTERMGWDFSLGWLCLPSDGLFMSRKNLLSLSLFLSLA